VLRVGVGGAAAAAAMLFVVAFSRRPWTAEPSEQGELRLAWRYRSERVTQCRTATPEELANLPAHMRQRTICEPRLRPYRLEVALDGRPAADDTVRPRGARADRPLGVFRRLPLPAGRHAVRLAFTPLPVGTDSLGAPLALDTAVILAARQVLLITYDEDAKRLVVRERPVEDR
jgi:hypothetical protein